MKIVKCSHCGNMAAMIHDSGVPMICCGEPMQEVVPNTEDAAVEKHVPAVTVNGNCVTVTVGSVEHPMTDVHYISWIMLETKQGRQRKELTPDQKPQACFCLCEGDEPVAAYEYCTLHGFWKAEI